LTNRFTERWHGHEAELVADSSARHSLEAARSAQNYDTAQLYAGQTVGLVERVEPAAEIVRRIVTDAEQRLQALTGLTSRATIAP